MSRTLDLVIERTDDGLELRSPATGVFTRAASRGEVLTPGRDAGTLLILGRPHVLRVPQGAVGLIASDAPPRLHEPVGVGTPLYRLTALEGAGGLAAVAAEEAAGGVEGLVSKSPQSGRFYHRPSPDADAFLKPGDVVEEGKPLGLIEVMKTFNHVLYRAEGGLPARARVVRYVAADGGDVSEGDALLEVEAV